MTFLRYVTFAAVPEFEAKGWKLHGPLNGNHVHYAVLMIWGGEGEPT